MLMPRRDALHDTGDLVAEGEWQWMAGANAIVDVSQIGMANAAGGDANQDFSGFEWRGGATRTHQRFSD